MILHGQTYVGKDREILTGEDMENLTGHILDPAVLFELQIGFVLSKVSSHHFFDNVCYFHTRKHFCECFIYHDG